MISALRTVSLFSVLCSSPLALPQNSPGDVNGQPEVDPNKLVKLVGFDIQGTHLPAASVIRLSQLKVGQMVNYNIINDACHRITSTGLVRLVDYAYNMQSNRSSIILSLKLKDELPLIPAKIAPAKDEEWVWACLQSADPIFERELPNTKNALLFYSANIDRCLENTGHRDEYAAPVVPCDGQGNAIQIVFNIRPRRLTARR